MLITSVNLWGVFLSGIVAMVIGSLWYSPLLFGKKWMKLIDMRPEDMAAAKATATKSYAISFVGSLIMAYVLSLVLQNMFVIYLSQAVLIGILLWIGFVATTSVSEYLFNAKPKPWTLYVLNNGYNLVVLVVMSVIIYFFK